MNPRTTGILFLIAAALGAFVWLYEIRGEAGRKEAEAATKRLFPGLEASAVERVELTTSDGSRARLERQDTAWRLVEPLSAPADEFVADAIASALAQLGSEAIYESPQPLAVYGLEDETREIRFAAGDAEHALRIGRKTPVGGNSYAWVGGGTRVYAVPTFSVNALSKTLEDLREKRILRFDAGAVERIDLRWPDGRVTLARAESGWRLEHPIVGPADETTVDALLNDLAFLRASGFVDEPTPEQRGAVEKPELAVELATRPAEEGQEPRRLALAIGAGEAGTTDRLVRADGPGLFRIPAERLHELPRDVASYRFRELARFDVEQAERLELAFQAPGAEALTVTATRAEAGWSSTPEAIEPAKLATLIDELSRLRAQKILADAMGEPELRELGLAPPNVRLTVSGEKGELARVEIGVAKGSEGVVARSGGGPTVYLLAGSAADFLPLSVEALRSRFRVEAPAAEAAEAPAAAPDAPEAASP